jgi:hypothetical protein
LIKTYLSTGMLSQKEVSKERHHLTKILFLIYLNLYDDISTLTLDAYFGQVEVGKEAKKKEKKKEKLAVGREDRGIQSNKEDISWTT